MRKIKIWTAGVIAVVALVAISFTAFYIAPFVTFCVMMSQIEETTVIETVTSPDGRYTAQLIDYDEGALGGATIIEVTDNSKQLDLVFMKIKSNPKQIYRGPWGEAFDMHIYWKDNNTLVADGKEYKMQE